jgi:DNA polymerase-4
MVLHQALKLCPDMLLVPPDHYFYEQKSRQVMDLLSNYTPCIEQNSIDEAWLDMTGTEGLFGKPVEAAQKIVDEIKDTLGLLCSVVYLNINFLQNASEMKKPWESPSYGNRIFRLTLGLPIGAMYGIGKKTAEKLNNLG